MRPRHRWPKRVVSVIGFLFVVTIMLPATAFASSAKAYSERAEQYKMSAEVNVRSTPSSVNSDNIIGRVFEGEKVTLLCQQRGNEVRGNSTWDYIEYKVGKTTKKKRGFVADYYVRTGRSGLLPGVPQGSCSGGGGGGPEQPRVSGDTLRNAQVMQGGDALTSPFGQYRLTMQPDGNLVLSATAGNRPLWDTGTHGRPGATATLQPDGNLVVHHSGQPVWGAGANGRGGTSLRIQDDRNVVIYGGNGAVWATHTTRTTGWIEKANWYGYPDHPNFTGLSMGIERTDKAIHGALDLQSAFDEALALAPPQKPYANWTYRSLYMQFRCHDDSWVARHIHFPEDYTHWDIDDWRHEVSYEQMTSAGCNPVGEGVTRPPYHDAP